MKKTKEYERVIFTSSVIEKILSELSENVSDPSKSRYFNLTISKGLERWSYDTLNEFLSELDGEVTQANIWITNPEIELDIDLDAYNLQSITTSVKIKSDSREKILRLGNVVDRYSEECIVPLPPEPEKPIIKPKIFIGHGNSPQWRDLKDHLHEQHGYEIIAYETGSRASHTIRDIITDMLKSSSFAILVMTGEDQLDDGRIMARQNVIHEIGLFQGHLGFSKAIVLKEEGTEEFSNIAGVHQIRYSNGNIKETFGDVLSVLRREFSESR